MIVPRLAAQISAELEDGKVMNGNLMPELLVRS